ncbi:MAG: ABC-F family ATP-binding cassette domain-containing protein, partial [Treponema sp.]|nr:ABC-F family ATP-binding cassette domain-containing protein [Treponema sp.]
ICKSYDKKTNVLNNLELVLENGERLVVTGRNGAGKSTLLRIIADADKDFTGEIIPGSGVKIGYFSQDNAETIKGKENILEYLENRAPLELIPKLRDMLGSFLFRGDDVYKSLDMLSGGEKSRIALLQLLLSPVNLLILDEPTNHLDIHSKDVLLEALKGFGGTVVFVSHDRGFIEQLATRVLELKPGQFKNFPGDYQFYMEQIQKFENAENQEGGKSLSLASATEPSQRSGSASSATHSSGGAPRNAPQAVSETKLSWEEQKKKDAERRKIEKEIARLEEEILSLEEKKSELDAKMADPAVYSNGEKAKSVQKQMEEIAQKIEVATAAWEQASEKLELTSVKEAKS